MNDPDTDLLAHAAELLVTTQFGSASMLTRKLRVGHLAAQQLLDQLHALGVVGPHVEGKARDVLPAADEYAAVVAAVRAGRQFVRPAHPANGVSTDQFGTACGLAYSAMPDDMPDVPARHLALRIVQLLMDAGWRPTR